MLVPPAAWPFLVATVANLPIAYLLVAANVDVALAVPVLAIGGLSMAAAWAAGSVIERRSEPHRRLFVWLIAAGAAVEGPALWALLQLRALAEAPAASLLLWGGLVSACGLLALALLARAPAAPARVRAGA